MGIPGAAHFVTRLSPDAVAAITTTTVIADGNMHRIDSAAHERD
jgi:hypothetical protein